MTDHPSRPTVLAVADAMRKQAREWEQTHEPLPFAIPWAALARIAIQTYDACNEDRDVVVAVPDHDDPRCQNPYTNASATRHVVYVAPGVVIANPDPNSVYAYLTTQPK
jgi:hypothetical protein